MKKTRKCILSIFLTLLLTAGSVPVTAWAKDAADVLAFAKDYMKNGATFTYGKMIQFSGDVSLPAIGQGTWYMG